MSEPTITDEELAERWIEQHPHGGSRTGPCGLLHGGACSCGRDAIPRLIAALRAERADNEKRRAEAGAIIARVTGEREILAAEVDRLRAELDGLVARVAERAPTLLYRIDL